MKAVLLLFDSLNRNYLQSYAPIGNRIELPNFDRLEKQSITFDSHYAGSLPCMPARRELHTGRYNFLHTGWSPLQPYDESVVANLSEAGIYTHIATDHFHYWENGGSCYLNQYDSFEMVRGQQGDPWIGQIADKFGQNPPNHLTRRFNSKNWRHDSINRQYITEDEDFPIFKTFDNGLDFINTNHDEDGWFLTIESFDPHEPFYVMPKWRNKDSKYLNSEELDWPDYGYASDAPEGSSKHYQQVYERMLLQCDQQLGRVLDTFDQYDLWQDTLLIVTTDHGFLLGEKGWHGKNVMPNYEEIARLPMFVFDPRHKSKVGQRISALTQTIDIVPTLSNFFGISELKHAYGYDLDSVIETNSVERKVALFGIHGKQVGASDGRYVLLKAPSNDKNQPLYDYTLMPQNMRNPFSLEELANATLCDCFKHTQGAKVLKVKKNIPIEPELSVDYLFDLESDPEQMKPIKDQTNNDQNDNNDIINVSSKNKNNNIKNNSIKNNMLELLVDAMEKAEAPEEQYIRLGLKSPSSKE